MSGVRDTIGNQYSERYSPLAIFRVTIIIPRANVSSPPDMETEERSRSFCLSDFKFDSPWILGEQIKCFPIDGENDDCL